MITRTENNGLRDVTVIKAEEGKALRRISDGQVFGDEVWLGKTWYLNGQLLSEPIDELPEHYEEIDAPEEEPEYEPDIDEQ